MKQSGIEWIGEIPDGWEVKRFKFIATSLEKGAGITKEEVFEDGDTPCVRYGEIYSKYNQSFSNCISKTFSSKIPAQKYFTNGDILFVGTGELVEEIGKCIAYLGNEKCLAGGDIIIAKHKQNPSFLSYAMNSSYAQNQKSRNKAKLKVVHISATEIGDVQIFLPPIHEQEAIAKMLDSKCAQIDSIIEESKKSIEEYKAWKQSVIFEAVTGKCHADSILLTQNPDEKKEIPLGISNPCGNKMKDSGIEWIGEIPEGWEVKRLKNLFDFGKGLPITKENLKETGVSVISYGQIHSKQNSGTRIDDSLKRFVDESYLTSNSNSLVHKSDFIFADTSEDLEGCGNCVYVDEEQTLFAGYHTIIFSSKIKQSNKYLAYLFKTDAWRNQIRSRCNGVKLFSITKRILSNVNVILPPLAEQEAIAKLLDSKCAQIDSLIAEKESLIADLTEYKKSLIFEVVTGKRSV